MANTGSFTPSKHEVERQLDLLLADEDIASHPQAAKLLKFIVEKTLEGEEITEKLIRAHVFPNPPYKEDSNIARVTMDKVRRLLVNYYNDEGEDDPVVIALPASPKGRKRVKFQAGEAYTPHFTYNPSGWIARELAIAYQLLRGSPAQMNRALAHFSKVERAAPNHPEVALGILEHWGMALMMGTIPIPDQTTFIGPLLWLRQVENAMGASWRTHNVRALLYFVAGERKLASEAFDEALTLDRQETIGRGWYLLFLFETGKEEQALRLMGLLAEQDAGNALAHAIHGGYLSRAHRHDEAELAFSKSLELDRNCWPAHYGMTRMYEALGRKKQAKEHEKRLKELLEPQELEQMGRTLGPGMRSRLR